MASEHKTGREISEMNRNRKSPDYIASIPTLSDSNINENHNCPLMYNQSWSATLHDVIYNFCRKNGILDSCDQIIPKSIIDVVALFYCNDITKYRSYEDYVNAILICKYFSSLKKIKKPEHENDINVKTKYKLTKKSALTTTKIFKATKDYKAKEFKIFNDEKVDDFEILFIDHIQNKYNLKQYSYPKDITYNISNDELNIISAIRDSIKLNDENSNELTTKTISEYGRRFQTKELGDILKKGNFKSGKKSIRLHTIIEYRNKALFAIDYTFTFSYFLFVFKFFTIIIHDKVVSEVLANKTMEAKVIANRYRGILEQFDQSGL